MIQYVKGADAASEIRELANSGTRLLALASLAKSFDLRLTLYLHIRLTIGIMQIGQLAAKAGVNVQTVRFYERERILREPPRNSSGYRLYGKSDLEDIRFYQAKPG